jgi:hypothetical protein
VRCRRAVVALILASSAVAGATSTSASAVSSGRLTLIGSRTASVIADLPAIPAMGGTTVFHLNAKIGGTFAGYMIYPLGGRTGWPLRAQIAAPGLHLGAQWAFPMAEEAIRPGRYRVVLFTDGPASITLATSSPGNVVLRPTHRLTSFGRYVGLDPATTAVHVGAIASVRAPAGVWDEAGMTGSWSSSGTHLHTSICLTSRTSCREGSVFGGSKSANNGPGQPGAGGYNSMGFDTVDLAIAPGDFFRLESDDVNGAEHGFLWGVRLFS